MNIDKIRELIEQDNIINRENLDSEALKVPYLHHKYYGFYLGEMATLKQLQRDLKSLVKFKTEYYTGRCSDVVYEQAPLRARVAKQELEIYLSADNDIQDIERKIDIQKLKCDYLFDFIKNVINSRGFFIRDAITFIKFKNGVS